MSTPKDLEADLNTVAHFVQAQADAGNNIDAMVNGQRSAFIAKIQQLKSLDGADATQLQSVVNDGPWPSDMKQALMEELAARLTRGRSSGNRAQQHCRNLEYWFPQYVWDVLDSHASETEQCECVGTFMQEKLGFATASEKTLGRAAAMIALYGLGNKAPSDTTLRALKGKVQSTIQYLDKRARYPHGHLAEYPHSYLRLPQQMRDHAYENDLPVDPPNPRAIDQLCAERTFLRGASKTLATESRFMGDGSGVLSLRGSPRGAHVAQNPFEQFQMWQFQQFQALMNGGGGGVMGGAAGFNNPMNRGRHGGAVEQPNGADAGGLGNLELLGSYRARGARTRAADDSYEVQRRQRRDDANEEHEDDGARDMERRDAPGDDGAQPPWRSRATVPPLSIMAPPRPLADMQRYVGEGATPRGQERVVDPLAELKNEMAKHGVVTAPVAEGRGRGRPKKSAKSSIKTKKLRAAAKTAARRHADGESDGADDADALDDDEEEDDEEDDSVVAALPTKRRPAAADDDEEEDDSAAPPTKKRPAAAKAASAPGKGGAKLAKLAGKAKPAFPPMPNTTAGAGPQTVHLYEGKITTSLPKQGFRVFRDITVPNPADKLIRWSQFASHQKAWNAACQLLHDDYYYGS